VFGPNTAFSPLIVITTGDDWIVFQGMSKSIASIDPVTTVMGRPSSSNADDFRTTFSNFTFPVNKMAMSVIYKTPTHGVQIKKCFITREDLFVMSRW
jgi:hypothetical protein